MLEIIGASLGFWLLYALIAIFAKHKVAIITTAILGLIAGISACAARGDYVTLVGSALAVVLILVITPLQINSEKKEELKKNNNKANSTQQNIGITSIELPNEKMIEEAENNVVSYKTCKLEDDFFDFDKKEWLPEYKSVILDVLNSQLDNVYKKNSMNNSFDLETVNAILNDTIDNVEPTPDMLKDRIIDNFNKLRSDIFSDNPITKSDLVDIFDKAIEKLSRQKDIFKETVASDVFNTKMSLALQGDKQAQYDIAQYYS
ncbi:MAG: hypothetical protein PHY08_13170, partial [Candidatus Cloacimonetes bacterium]|nr:hypothetical protein [Candidatus Cloacimonadota bacterium]